MSFGGSKIWPSPWSPPRRGIPAAAEVLEQQRRDHAPDGIRGRSRKSESSDPAISWKSSGDFNMTLGKRQSGGEIIPRLQFDARSGTLYRVDRVREANGTWSNEQKNVTDGFAGVFDLENIEVGWIAFTGGPPSFTMF